MRPSVTGGSHRRAEARRPRLRWFIPMLVVSALLVSGLGGPELFPVPGPFVSDDFSTGGLGGHWWTSKPRGVGDVRVSDAARGRLALSVPAGVNHNAWTTNDTVRVVQRVNDADLDLTAGFQSIPFARYQMQGLTALHSRDTFVRYEVRHDGAGLRLFGSVTTGGVPEVVLDQELPELTEVHLRLRRSGDDWRLEWAPDGSAWTVATTFRHRMPVVEVGPYVGNVDPAGNAPAFTALVDYVVDGEAPPAGGATGVSPVAGANAPPPGIAQVAVHERTSSVRVSWVTDELTTGVVEYGTSDSYGSTSEPTPVGLGHSVTLHDLEPDTNYHFRLVVTDEHGQVTTGDDRVFTTAPPREPPLFQNDAFVDAVLGPHWEVVTPLGVGEVGVTPAEEATGQSGGGSGAGLDGRLTLHVPPGHQHDPWQANDSVRAVQQIPDGDLTLEASFVSMPSRRYQSQGLTVLESRLTYLRYEVHHDGAGLRLFASVTTNGRPVVVLDEPLPELPAVRLRVERTDDRWALFWSDGERWSQAAVFTHRMVTTEMGPFAASYHESGAAPGFAALVDEVSGTGPGGLAAAEPEPLEIEDITVDDSTNNVLIRWETTRDAAAYVEYGTDKDYGDESDATQPGTVHSVALEGLRLGTTYHYRVVATDPNGTQVVSKDRTFTTPANNTGPTIDLWYGTKLIVGAPVTGQRWVNVVGNVSDDDGVRSLSYSVNGGARRELSLGPDQRRLQWPGDFNADIPLSDLNEGTNTVILTATDNGGRTTSRTVTVERRGGEPARLPYTVQWQPGVSVARQAQVVDGKWTVSEEGLRTDITGYDRLVVVGDVSWTDYEVTVPVTVHELGPAAYTQLSNAPVIGVGVRWNGHTAVDNRQPAWSWYPTGAFAWYRFHQGRPRLELIGTDDEPRSYGSPYFELGGTFILKVRVRTLDNGNTRYQASMWRQGEPDPGIWYTEIEYSGGPESGAVLLVAHQLYGTFGDVTVAPL